MELEKLGYYSELNKYRKENNLDSFDIGRVILEHKERYVVKTTEAEYEAEIIGNLRFTASSRADFPAVGDWVAISEYDKNKVLIHAILPRKTIIERQAVGKVGEKQIIATNVDFGLIVQAVDRDFNINRLERYLTICYNSKVEPAIILNKIDLIDESALKDLLRRVQDRLKVKLLTISNVTKEGYTELINCIQNGKTYCLLGSSGVGKSTLLNNLLGEENMKTGEISSSTNKGRHVTSHRELVCIKNGGILIDNPGMRELGVADSSEGLDITFDKIAEAATNCKYKDCTHTNENGCAVITLVESGEIDSNSYGNYLKMEKEKAHFTLTVNEKRQKDKDFGKMIKNFKKDIQKVNAKYYKKDNK